MNLGKFPVHGKERYYKKREAPCNIEMGIAVLPGMRMSREIGHKEHSVESGGKLSTPVRLTRDHHQQLESYLGLP